MNKFIPHLKILCEDQATYDLANGFYLGYLNKLGNISSYLHLERRYLGGWPKFENTLRDDLLDELSKNQYVNYLFIMDFDGIERENRLYSINKFIRENNIQDRVFILGCKKEPQDLKNIAIDFIKRAGDKFTMQNLGKALFSDCDEKQYKLWGSDHLQHNFREISHLRDKLTFLDFIGE